MQLQSDNNEGKERGFVIILPINGYMKKRIYTKRDFEICRIIMITFIILDFICVVAERLMRVIEMPELIEVLAFWGALLLPILIVMTCWMCVERYWFVEFHSEERRKSMQCKVLCGFSIILILALGYATFHYTSDIITYITYNWNLRDQLNTCVIMKGAIALGWLVVWVFSIIVRKNITVGTGIKKWLSILGSILLVVVLFYITARVNDYVDEQAECVFWDKFTEYAEKYGALTKPFSRN